MAWPEAVVYIILSISAAVFLSIFFGTINTGRWPWDRN